MGDYQGSQAFAQIDSASESVNQSTGSLNFVNTIIDIRGVHTTINLKLELNYSTGTAGSYGLPSDWTFNIPYVSNGKSVTFNRRTWLIDPQWTDTAKYQSGLRYNNNHGLKFSSVVGKLPSDAATPYGYSLRMNDGSIDYFDRLGRLLEHNDAYGNRLTYKYKDSTSPPETALLASITDSWLQETTFSHQPGLYMKITDPNKSVTRIEFSDKGVAKVIAPESFITDIFYTQHVGRTVIDKIRHPTGLASKLFWQSLPYIDAQGLPQKLPAVSLHQRSDSQGQILTQTKYHFGSASGSANFTGNGIQCRLKADTDTLMDSNNKDYLYDVLIESLGATGVVLASGRTFFNSLHLPKKVIQYSVDASGYATEAFKDVSTYPVSTDKYARTPNYAQPIVFDQYRVDPSGKDKLLRRVTSSYDDEGGALEIVEKWSTDGTESGLIDYRGISNSYTRTSWGGEMLTSQTHTDCETRVSRRIENTLTSDKKNVEISRMTIKRADDQAFQPWKTKSYTFDTKGRTTSEKVSWSPGVAVPDETVSSYTITMTFSFDADKGTNEISTDDGAGHFVSSTFSTKLPGGPVLSKQLPLGQSESFEYDLLGRAVRHVDPFGNVTRKTYINGSQENSSTTTNSQEYVMKTILDPLGRIVRQCDNGDPTKAMSPDPSRILSTTAYDMRSQVTVQTDDYGIRTTFDKYDSFGRLLQKTDSLGNKTSWVFDDDALTRTSLVNDQLRSTIQYDVRGRAVSQTSFGDSVADPTLKYALLSKYTYDAFDNVLVEEMFKQPLDASAATLLSRTSVVHDYEFAISRKTIEARCDSSGMMDSVRRNYLRDLFGNIYRQDKNVEYSSGAKFNNTGPQNIFDKRNKLVLYRNVLGQEEHYSYDDNGHPKTMTRYDTTVSHYTSDALGRVVDATCGSAHIKRTYAPNGRLSQVEVNNQVTKYTYALDGGLESTSNPASATLQRYTLDLHSRVLDSTDTNGVSTIRSYDEHGRTSTRKCKADTVTYHYGTVNNMQGLPVGDTLNGSRAIDRAISYDGFGRTKRITTRDRSSGQIILDAGYTYDAFGRIKVVELSSQVAATAKAVNYNRTFEYDGLGQVRKDSMQYAAGGSNVLEYTYDGNSNVLTSTSTDSSIVKPLYQAMTYNAIDQRTDSKIEYDTNGKLRRDAFGTIYDYNDIDQLVSITSKGGPIRYQYSPESSLLSRSQGTETTQYLYDGGAVNATKVSGTIKNEASSYMIAPEQRISEYRTDADSQARYFISSQGSTSITLGTSGGESTASYNAYGTRQTSGGMQKDEFGYKQEWNDPSNGVVYLRSRFYHPELFSFITMDATHKENRYAFCEGDPINSLDPSGHSKESTAVAVGLIVGIIVSAIVSEGATLAIDLAFAKLATDAIATSTFAAMATSVTAGAISGMAGNVAGDAVTSAMEGKQYTMDNFRADVVSGLAGGFTEWGVGAGLTQVTSKTICKAESWTMTRAVIARWGKSTISGAAGGFATSLTAAGMLHEDLFSLGTLWGTLAGAGGSALGSAREEAWHYRKGKPHRATRDRDLPGHEERMAAGPGPDGVPIPGEGEPGHPSHTLNLRLREIKVKLRGNAMGLAPSSYASAPSGDSGTAGNNATAAQANFPSADGTEASYKAQIARLASRGGLYDSQHMADAVRLQVFSTYPLLL